MLHPPSASSSHYRDLLYKAFHTGSGVSPLMLRLSLAVTMFPHGAQKALGWFNGIGYTRTVTLFERIAGVPKWLAIAAIFAEFGGAILLAMGLFTRLAAFSIGFIMVMAIIRVHWKNGFFMNWTGMQAGEGYEFFIPVLAIILVLVLQGGGRWSLDRLLTHHKA